jgi:hypothetical protein
MHAEAHTPPNTGLDQGERGFTIVKQRPKEAATASYKRIAHGISIVKCYNLQMMYWHAIAGDSLHYSKR